jgi:hypothetical protein
MSRALQRENDDLRERLEMAEIRAALTFDQWRRRFARQAWEWYDAHAADVVFSRRILLVSTVTVRVRDLRPLLVQFLAEPDAPAPARDWSAHDPFVQ